MKPLAPQRAAQELAFSSHDGTELFYRHWPAQGVRRGAIVLLHRGHKHGGRMAHLVDELNLPGFDFFAWDARGHGRSPGRRGYSPGFSTLVQDLQSFVEHLGGQHEIDASDIHVIAQSVGAVVAACWAHDYAPKIRGLTLASPAFRVKLYVPFARPGLRLLNRLRGEFFVNSYVKPRFLTHDPERIASYAKDPLITRPIAVNVLLGLYDAAERVVQDAQAIVQPTQLLISGADWVVHHEPQHRFFEQLGSEIKEKHVLPGFFHDTLGEKNREDAVRHVRRFILSRFDTPLSTVDLLNADTVGATAEEARHLAAPLSMFTPRGLYWALVRANLRLGGLLSTGIRLGHATGFDSGSTLDYVYRNEPQGVPLIGVAVDRTYLDAIGWRGIRQRKKNLEWMLQDAMRRLSQGQQEIRLLDIAAGHGRYMLDAITNCPVQPQSMLLRDYSDINVSQGQQLINNRQLGHMAQFVKADAFDRESLAAVSPRPTLAVVSGLYELFPDNPMVRRSLAGLAEALAPGGFLVYTGQPWHPQLEMIARALTSHRQGQAWVMRRRTQAEMDQLVEAAGFRKITQRIDEWGIFTVSLAIRKAD